VPDTLRTRAGRPWYEVIQSTQFRALNLFFFRFAPPLRPRAFLRYHPNLMTQNVQHRPPQQPLVEPKGVELMRLDMTAIISAAMTLGELQARLAEANQWLPIDGDEHKTIGELVSENWIWGLAGFAVGGAVS